MKSDNFLIERVDGGDHVTMIDFGLAQILAASADAGLFPDDLVISGTPEYMAPEVIDGDPPLPASDLYGAGVILYELLTGTTPFQGGSAVEIMMRHTRDKVIAPSARTPDRCIPPAIDRVVLEALDKDPERRYPDAATFAHELWAAAGIPRGATRTPLGPEDGSTQEALPAAELTRRSRRRLARGSDCRSPVRGDIEAHCQSIAGALRRGDVAAIADGYLELASALVQQRRFARAARELQEGIDILTVGCDPHPSDTPPAVDRLVVALAALYDEGGNARRARSVATSIDRSPTWTSAIG